MSAYELLLILAPAFFAGAIIALTHVPLGIEVLKRGIIFIDLAIAQIAGLGIIICKNYIVDEHSTSLFSQIMPELFAFIFAFLAGVFFKLMELKTKHLQEALIGCSFVVASSIGLLLFSKSPHGSEEIEAVLAGQILWSSWRDIAFIAILTLIVSPFIYSSNLRQRFFYIIFAICITLSVQVIGVYLVFATLIFPALFANDIKHAKTLYAIFFAVFSYLAGLIVSVIFDFPASPSIVISFAIVLAVKIFTKQLFGAKV